MVNYNSGNVVQCLRQYDMFANSLKLVKVREERDMIIKQLTKLESKIIDLTNEVYEEEYYALANKETYLLDDECKRLNELIELINQRLTYIEKRNNNHYQLTGDSVDIKDVVGSNTLDNLEDRLNIIEKYQQNIKLAEELEEGINSLTNKLSLVKEKIDINESLNKELEKKMCILLSDTFEKLNLYKLLDNKEEIEFAYYETEKNLKNAEQNLEIAKTSPLNILNECQEMVMDAKEDYVIFKEKLCILKLMEIFNREVNSYDELLVKRKEMNELLKNIKDEELNILIADELINQYETIMKEIQDVNTHIDLEKEKDRKQEVLAEIEEENNSDRFQSVLSELIENERKRQEQILAEQRRIEEEERKKRLEIERKKQEEILKKQKIIEETRKKEIEQRTKEMLEYQQKSVLQPKKKEKTVSFETIKDLSEKDEEKNEKNVVLEEKLLNNYEKNIELETPADEVEEYPVFKNKIDIEKELFEEFNSKDENEGIIPLNEESEISEAQENKLPDISIDEYMNNFQENDLEDDQISSLFQEDDIFPNIPL